MMISIAKHGSVSVTNGKPNKLIITGHGVKPLHISWSRVNFIGKDNEGNLIINGESYAGLADQYHKVSGEHGRQNKKEGGHAAATN